MGDLSDGFDDVETTPAICIFSICVSVFAKEPPGGPLKFFRCNPAAAGALPILRAHRREIACGINEGECAPRR